MTEGERALKGKKKENGVYMAEGYRRYHLFRRSPGDDHVLLERPVGRMGLVGDACAPLPVDSTTDTT